MNELEVERVLAIAAEAAAADGVEHLDEAARLELAHRPETVTGVVNENGFAVVTGGTLALVVRPSARGRERAHALLARVREFEPRSAWSHGDHPAAAALADSAGWVRDRDVVRMARPPAALPDVRQGADASSLTDVRKVEMRGFTPGDEADILRVNAAAFAHHPEQGAMTAAGLAERMAEPWFNPDDLLVCWAGERLAGFNWIKRVSGCPDEIYLFAVDPEFHGRHVGSALLRAGMATMADAQVYTDADNARARRLYERAGFEVAEVHAHYARP
jgi:mycothiol synthase